MKKLINTAGFAAATFLVAASFYFQYVLSLEPCALCILQRTVIMVLGGLFFWGLWIKRHAWIHLQSFLILSLTAIGLYASGRQIYLQRLPKHEVPGCGPSLDVMLHMLPWQETIKLLFKGTGDCAKIDWTLFTFTMPEWTFAAFIFFLILGLTIPRLNRS